MNILYVEDDPGLCNLLSTHLRAQGHNVTTADGAQAARRNLADSIPEVMICDHDLGDGTGLDLIIEVLDTNPGLPCVMLTGVGDEALAVKAMKAGAHDYIVKDIENNFLTLVPTIIERIGKELALEHDLKVARLEQGRLEARNRYLASTLEKEAAENLAVGQDRAFKHVMSVIWQVAPTDATVLILGETGTGKELAARIVHRMSARTDQPFITVNCAALPANLVESELFGHEKGAFTGAIKTHVGRFEAADGGTLFLDEIGEIPIELQPKLLRVLQESAFERVGGTTTQNVDVRIIAATNQDLKAMTANKTFREDLYYRINVIPIEMPPLRGRGADLELLFMYFINHASERHNIEAPHVSDALLDRVRSYSWPGNVRELINFVERGVITRKWDLPSLTDAQPRLSPASDETALTLSEMERRHIVRILQRTDGLISGDGGAAQILGLPANTLRSRMKKLGIEKPKYSL
ncbi:MAG: sigma-54 dependent transcriptional regulator [Candidatus Thiodiazotropha sp. (ex Dulcina madagascariensis)]|nr:sigma-54 dependent transcriptional regulator [Candidatus Thiodiazotropha sp. (ex Dulcina madagascariensis)]